MPSNSHLTGQADRMDLTPGLEDRPPCPTGGNRSISAANISRSPLAHLDIAGDGIKRDLLAPPVQEDRCTDLAALFVLFIFVHRKIRPYLVRVLPVAPPAADMNPRIDRRLRTLRHEQPDVPPRSVQPTPAVFCRVQH